MNYFAYGSNMLRQRLTDRVGVVRGLGTVSLRRYRLTFHKRGSDGSGKCTLVESDCSNQGVWGVLFQLSTRQRLSLDRYEGVGYESREITLNCGGTRTTAVTYISTGEYIDTTLKPYPWYKGLVLAGAIQADFPKAYIEALGSIMTIQDSNTARTEANHRLIIDSGYDGLLPELGEVR